MANDEKQLIYITSARIPTEKANGYQIAKMCEEFANLGYKVSLIVPKRKNHIKENVCNYYKLQNNFRVSYLFCIDFLNISSHAVVFFLLQVSFSLRAFIYALFNRESIFFTRDEFVALFISLINKKIIYEVHSLSEKNFIQKIVLKKIKKIVTISEGLKKEIIIKGIDKNKILVAPDGVDLQTFENLPSKIEARKLLNLPINKKILMYTGHLYSWKGVYTLVDSAKFLEKNYEIILVGGTVEDIRKMKEYLQKNTLTNVTIAGHRPHEKIPYYLAAADVLILPNTAKEKISSHYTSPIKLFEYMASGAPIMASDLPSIREILDEDSACFFQPDNPLSFTETINNLNHDQVKLKAIRAKEKVKNYTWKKRAENIIKIL